MTTTTLLSQRAEPSLLWSGPCLESLMGRGLARIPRVGCDNHVAGRRPACPGVGRCAAPGGGGSGGSDPWFLALVRHRAGGGGAHQNSHHSPLPGGGRSLHSDPGGKAIERLFALMVDGCVSVWRCSPIVALCVVVCLYVAPCTASYPRLSRNPATAPAPPHRAAPQPPLLAARPHR